MRRLPYQVVLYMVATLAFASVAMAQQGPAADYTGPCSVVNEQFGTNPDYYSYVPEVDGCVVREGPPVVGYFNNPVFDTQTGENLGLYKDLVDITVNRVEHTALCGAFPIPDSAGPPLAGLTAQQYFEQRADAQAQAILDPNSDGQACTAEDAAFLSGDTGADGAADDGAATADGAADGGADPAQQPAQGQQPAQDQQPQQQARAKQLPATGGPNLLLPVAALLLGSGVLAYATLRRR